MTHRPSLLLACALTTVSACGRHATHAPDVAAAAPAVDAGTTLAIAHDAAVAPVDAGPRFTPPTRIVALGTWVPVRKEPRRDSSLVGYLRAGAITAVEGMPVGRERCPVHREYPEGGWYRLAGGGFVCVGGALAVPWPAPRGVLRPAQPQLDAGMPYQYAIVYGRAMMYRAPPTMDELRVHESWRFRHEEDDAGAPAATAASATTATNAGTESTDDTASASATAAPSADAPTRRDRRDRHAQADAPSATNAASATTDSAETPNGEPRLRDLRGERSGPLIRRLLTGMYVALDRTVVGRGDGERYWHTQSGGYVRTGPLSVLHDTPSFTGVVLDEQHTLPFAFMVSNTGSNYRIGAGGHSVSEHHRLPRLTAIPLSAEPPFELGTQTYLHTADGLAVNRRNVRLATVRPPPEGIGPTEKWIDVDLEEQVLVAYEGPRPVFVTLVSTGRRSNTDDPHQFETPAGHFRIRGKHVTTTMDGDTAADGPYSIEDVPWVEYFFESYALHGAFWHGNYGWRMSHGCVNLSPSDARWMFYWTDPQLPEGWHGIFTGPEHPGTRIELHHGEAATPNFPPERNRESISHL